MIKVHKRWFAVIVNPFLVLGLNDNASLSEAKESYKKLVLKYHPDISKTLDSAEKFREITEAYGMVKKRIESRESIAIPKEDGFTSKRPKYDGTISSVLRDDKIREYINFRPLDIELPNKDRLGIEYRPFFQDQDSVHPKTGTIGIIIFCCTIVSIYSYYFMNLRQRDELVNQILYEKLQRKYNISEWDLDSLHPSLQAAKNDPDYEAYLREKNDEVLSSKFKAFQIAPSVLEKFNSKEFQEKEPSRDYKKIK